jgi:hypothetical protein
MADTDPFMRFLAGWALVHETADEGWKAAVARGEDQEPGEMGSGPEAFVDGLSAMVAEEKERLKAELAEGLRPTGEASSDLVDHIDELRFEVAELRGRLESLQATLEGLLGPGGDPAGD